MYSSNLPTSERENQRYYILDLHFNWIKRRILVVNIDGSLVSAFVLEHEKRGSDLWRVLDFKRGYFDL